MKNAILAALLALATLSPLSAGTPFNGTVNLQKLAELQARVAVREAQEAALRREMQLARTRAAYERARYLFEMAARATRESRQVTLAYKAALARR